MDVESRVDEGDARARIVDHLMPAKRVFFLGFSSRGVRSFRGTRLLSPNSRKVVVGLGGRFDERAVHLVARVRGPFEQEDQRPDGFELAQEVGIESPQLFDFESLDAEVVQEARKDARVCARERDEENVEGHDSGRGETSTGSGGMTEWRERLTRFSQRPACRVRHGWCREGMPSQPLF